MAINNQRNAIHQLQLGWHMLVERRNLNTTQLSVTKCSCYWQHDSMQHSSQTSQGKTKEAFTDFQTLAEVGLQSILSCYRATRAGS